MSQFIKSLLNLLAKGPQVTLVTSPGDLLSLLVHHFHLQVEGTTDALHRSALFQKWCAQDVENSAFGAYGPMQSQNLAGKNTFLILHSLTQYTPKDHVFGVLKGWIDSKKPTRIVMIASKADVEHYVHPKDRRVFEIAHIPSQFPFTNCCSNTSCPTSIVLILNKESMLSDPIDWPSLKNDLRDWADSLHIELSIPDWTDKLFLERAFSSHGPRAAPSEAHFSGCIYRFFDPLAPRRLRRST